MIKLKAKAKTKLIKGGNIQDLIRQLNEINDHVQYIARYREIISNIIKHLEYIDLINQSTDPNKSLYLDLLGINDSTGNFIGFNQINISNVIFGNSFLDFSNKIDELNQIITDYNATAVPGGIPSVPAAAPPAAAAAFDDNTPIILNYYGTQPSMPSTTIVNTGIQINNNIDFSDFAQITTYYQQLQHNDLNQLLVILNSYKYYVIHNIYNNAILIRNQIIQLIQYKYDNKPPPPPPPAAAAVGVPVCQELTAIQGAIAGLQLPITYKIIVDTIELSSQQNGGVISTALNTQFATGTLLTEANNDYTNLETDFRELADILRDIPTAPTTTFEQIVNAINTASGNRKIATKLGPTDTNALAIAATNAAAGTGAAGTGAAAAALVAGTPYINDPAISLTTDQKENIEYLCNIYLLHLSILIYNYVKDNFNDLTTGSNIIDFTNFKIEKKILDQTIVLDTKNKQKIVLEFYKKIKEIKLQNLQLYNKLKLLQDKLNSTKDDLKNFIREIVV